MNNLQNTFESALKEYEGKHANLLSVYDVVATLKKELPRYFTMWMEQNPILDPIAEIKIEVDSLGYFYTSLINEKGFCMEGEAATADLEDLELIEIYEEDPTLVIKFLALCYEIVLPEVCKTHEFLSLPRTAKIVFSIGEHSGWECEKLYEFNGKPNVIDHRNVRLKILRKGTSCYTKPDTLEHKFMDHLHHIDVHKCATQLSQPFENFLIWLKQQNTTPVEVIALGWSSNFDNEPAFGAYCENGVVHRFPFSGELYKWFSEERPADLDEDDFISIRYCMSHKIAEIACVMMENIIETDAFKAIPKQDNFIMKVGNRTAGYPQRFYPFT